MKNEKWGLVLIGLTVGLSACEKMDFSEAEETKTTVISQPTQTGKGTLEAPLTVTQFLNEDSLPDTCWVIGYAVGSTYRTIKNANFGASDNYDVNLLLADDTLCTETELCLPVELRNSSMREEFSLSSHPEHYKHCILIQGLSGIYFTQPGIRNALTAQWYPNLDINEINPLPEEWEEVDYNY